MAGDTGEVERDVATRLTGGVNLSVVSTDIRLDGGDGSCLYNITVMT